jgi:uncharacterized DUF497 family protein
MYIHNRKYEWNRGKSRQNQKKHGCLFDIVEGFDWSEAVDVLDDRFDYGEERWLALGPIGSKLYALAFSARSDEKIRVISLRLATKNERKAYVQARRQSGGEGR